MTTTIISGGNFDFQTIHSGTTLEIEGSAFTSQDDVQNGAVLIIKSGALPGETDEFTTIDSGGTEYLSGSIAYDDGYFGLMQGTQVVLDGGLASATQVGSGGQIFVSSGSDVTSAIVSGGGTITVLNDGEASGDSLLRGAVEIVSSGLAFGEAVNAGAILTLSAAGGADDVKLYGGAMVVFAGGVAATTAISSGGREAVDAGGTTDLDNVYSAGTQTVASRGVASGVNVYGGGSQTVLSGGSALATVLNGGTLVVSAGGSAVNTQILPNGSLDLQAGAIATGAITFAGAGGVAEIDAHVLPAVTISGFAAGDTIYLAGVGSAGQSTGSAGSNGVLSFTEGGSSYTLAFDSSQNFSGVVFDLLADGAGTQIQISGVVHSGPIVANGGQLSITSGQISSYVTVETSGYVLVSSGGELSAGVVSNGGNLYVELGDVDGLTVSSGGFAELDNFSGLTGAASDVTVEAHATFGGYGTFLSTTVNGGSFEPGGISAVSTTINSGGVEYQSNDAIFTTVNRGGSLIVQGHATSTTLSGGSETVHDGTATDTVIDGGLLNMAAGLFAGAASATSGITFGAGDGTLEIGSGAVMSATVSGFAAGDTIDLTNLAPGSAPTASVNSANELVVSGGGTTYELAFAAGYTGAHFQVTSDTGSGSLVTELPCYAAGTRIATAGGEVAVEHLARGDQVRTENGRLAPVRWLGYRRVDCRRHPRPWNVWPVRVRVGAFGGGTPRRDLLLSPDHAVFFDGVLIPVRYLINGSTIAKETAECVTYWHVELDRHDAIVAEGLPCESYLDTGNRAAFANGGAFVKMHPEFALRIWAARAFAPLVIGGPRLAAAKRRLLTQATALGHVTTTDPELKILVDGHMAPAKSDGQRWQVRLPKRTRSVRLLSRVWSPSQMRPDDEDARSLGVAIARIALDGREVGLASKGLASGWHAPEPGWRWTDGNSALAVGGAGALAFEVAMTGTYWSAAPRGRIRPVRASPAGARGGIG